MNESDNEYDSELINYHEENFDDTYFDGEDLDEDVLFALWEIDVEDLETLEDLED